MGKVLVTGGAGFIGSHTVDKLIDEGLEVRVLDILQKPVHMKGIPEYLNKKAEFVLGDVRDKDTLTSALKDVDYVYHFAAYQDYLPDFSNFFHTNAVSTALIYEIIVEKKLNVKKVIVASSQFVQGEGLYKTNNGEIISPTLRADEQLSKGLWNWKDDNGEDMEWMWTPETHVNPPNAYAMSKYSQEMQAMRFGKRYDIPSTAFRYSIVQGPRQSFYNAYSGACRIFSLSYFFDKAPVIYEDGNQKRDFVNVRDVINANLLALRDSRTDFEVYNVGGGKAYTIIEFDRIVAKEFGKERLSPNLPGEYRFGDTRNACSDTTKLRALGWSPKFDAVHSVKEYRSYLESQTDINDILAYAEKSMKNLNVVRAVTK